VISVDDAWNQEVQYEKCVDHLYKDDKGYPTAGCGNLMMLATMMALPWRRRDNDQEASTDEIQADWNSVAKLPGNMSDAYYAKFTKLYLPVDNIKKLFSSRLVEFAHQLAGIYADYDTWPRAAQLAELDMIFNLGIGTYLTFTSHVTALKKRPPDWQGAADSCHRKNKNPNVAKWDPSDKHERRQIMVRDLLLSCINSVS